jgi:hypothetical protein
MKYEEALKKWGAEKAKIEDWESVSVDFDWNEGYACCGGSDPDCYCSFAESASFNVVVKVGKKFVYNSDIHYDMGSFLKELFEVADRT